MAYRYVAVLVVTVGLVGMGFTGQAAPPAGFSMVQVCDPQLGFGGYEHDLEMFRLAVSQINETSPDLVVICGDLVNETGSDTAFQDFNQIRSGFAMPCHCVAGNHDVGNEPTLAALTRYRQLIGPDHYSFEQQGYTFVVVNTQLWQSPVSEETRKQDSWLETALQEASSHRQPVIVLGHIPLFVETFDEEDSYYNLPLQTRHWLLGLFEEHGVKAYLCGHTQEHCP